MSKSLPKSKDLQALAEACRKTCNMSKPEWLKAQKLIGLFMLGTRFDIRYESVGINGKLMETQQ